MVVGGFRWLLVVPGYSKFADRELKHATFLSGRYFLQVAGCRLQVEI